MSEVCSFPPVIGHDPRILILGSMPGTASLQAVEYYAHPRNAFWPIMADLFDFDAGLDYQDKIARLRQLPLILWDTLARCYRPGSLDSDISTDSVEANDIGGLLAVFPGIRAIAFNGLASEKYFRRLVLPGLHPGNLPQLVKLPSTSPANAGMTLAEKTHCWRGLLEFAA